MDILQKINKNHFRFYIGRDKKDVEKAILPTIIFVNTNHPTFKELRSKGFMVIIGWWDFNIKIGVIS